MAGPGKNQNWKRPKNATCKAVYPWNPQDDAQLLRAAPQWAPQWTTIAMVIFSGRYTAQQCLDRFNIIRDRGPELKTALLEFPGAKNGNGFSSEEELPPPLLSKEDWRHHQRMKGGGSSVLGGIGDRRKVNRAEDGSEVDSEKVRGSELIGFPGLGNKQKNLAEIFRDDLGRTIPVPGLPSRPASHNAFYENVESIGSAEADLAHLRHDLMSYDSLSASQSMGPPSSYTYGRSTTLDPHIVARAPSPCLTPIGGGRASASEKRGIESSRKLEIKELSKNIEASRLKIIAMERERKILQQEKISLQLEIKRLDEVQERGKTAEKESMRETADKAHSHQLQTAQAKLDKLQKESTSVRLNETALDSKLRTASHGKRSRVEDYEMDLDSVQDGELSDPILRVSKKSRSTTSPVKHTQTEDGGSVFKGDEDSRGNGEDYTKFTVQKLKQELTKHNFGAELLQLRNPNKKEILALYEQCVLQKSS